MTFRWLHLSDTHFREGELWDRRATLRALIAKVAELKDKGLAPDIVFVTGDIAWSGKPREYEQATRFFHELNKVLKLDPKESWFLVPGNHDVDRSRITRSHRAIQGDLADETIVEETLRDPEAMRLLSTRLEAYYAFTAGFLGAARTLQPDRPWRTDVREFNGISIGILQLNSAWIAEGGETDKANLLVGEAQVREALDATPDAFLRIALMHHPLRNLREFDDSRVQSLLGANNGAAFLLRGHLHLNHTSFQSSPDGNFFEIAAGALYTAETNWPRGFHLGEVDLDKGEARIHLFRYSGESTGFFAPDNLTYENARSGICKIKLRAVHRLGGKKANPPETISEDQRLSFTARYRNAAASYHGHARFIGFPNQAARPNARVSDLFVPLRMRLIDRVGDIGSVTTANVARLLLSGPAGGPAPVVVVLGAPGSGKTTLSRFLVMLAAGAITMTGVEVATWRLPLRVAFRDFVERQRQNPTLSLLEYLDVQAKAEFSLALPRNFIRKAIDSGQAMLILDGLDEVGAADERAEMRDLVAAFASTHKKLPILVTSRIAGYDDAPLLITRSIAGKRNLQILFWKLALEKFNDSDLRAFVTQWYSVQEPSDPVARDRGIADLLTALNGDDRVRELARTPILATLIAMIHRVEANLPGERAKLYELCVRMLLETWPAQAKRPFDEIDAGLQRAYLESLAFAMQISRTIHTRETVTIARGDLIARLLPILRKRDYDNEPEERVAGIIGRWIDHLEKHSGILSQQSTGIYGFFHLSIMEYLASQGMERELGGDAAIGIMAQRVGDPLWQEVCLLAVGSHAENGEYLDSVYETVRKTRNTRRWEFLIRCLREEARFRPEQRETILNAYSETLLQDTPNFTDTLVRQIRRFSVRHGEAVQRWIERRLNEAVGDELAAAAAAVGLSDSQVVSDHLTNRRDKAVAAAALMEFWPGAKLGDWAARTIDAPEALTWTEQAPFELVPLRAVAAIGAELHLIAIASIVSLHLRTSHSRTSAFENVARLKDLARRGGSGLPAQVIVEPGHTIVRTVPRSVNLTARLTAIPRSARALALGLSSGFGTKFTHECARDFQSYFASNFSLPNAEVFAEQYIGHRFGDVFTSAFAVDFARVFSKTFAPFASDFLLSFGLEFDAFASDSNSLKHQTPRTHNAEGEPGQAAGRVIAAMGAEAWVAVATMAENTNVEERVAYLNVRLQNRWLFDTWRAIDLRLPENPTPAQLALYFALGWAQSTTTWTWPDSDRWRTLFAAGPGEHWLVRSQWHLCKLTDDPSSKEDDAGLRAALRDGHGDESLPGYAARLSEVLGIEA